MWVWRSGWQGIRSLVCPHKDTRPSRRDTSRTAHLPLSLSLSLFSFPHSPTDHRPLLHRPISLGIELPLLPPPFSTTGLATTHSRSADRRDS